jgi:peptide/nickel transport system substrate-binding protein
MKKLKAFAAVLAAVALAMSSAPAGLAAGKTLTLGATQKPVSLAADQGEYGQFVWYYQSVYDTVLRQKEDGTIVPGLATKWSYNADQTILTLEIRRGVKFSDGTALNAAAVAKNLNANKVNKGPNASQLTSLKSAIAKGENQVVVTLTDTDPAFVNYLANAAGLIASPKTIGSAAAASNPIGSGPYILSASKTRPGSKYVYTANPTYWDKSNRKYDNLVINVYADQSAMVNAIRSGAVQGGNVADAAAANSLVNSGMKSSSSFLDAQGIYFSDRSGKHNTCIAKKEVRQAINMAFDRPALAQSLANGEARVTTQFFPTFNAGFDSALDKKYAYDIDGAKRLMTAAGYANGCSITMPTVAGYFGEATYAVIKSQLGKIGITVVEVSEGNTFFENILGNKYDAYFMSFGRDAEPWQMLNFMIAPKAQFNTDGYATPTVTKLIADYKKATAAKRPAILKSINREITNDAWFAVWYAKKSNFIYTDIVIKQAQAGSNFPFLYNIG